jgi:glycosyltransferase involved in cell wall biosynthesis
MAYTIAYILGSFPDGNPPFIINEIKGLIKEGIDILVFPIHKVNTGGRVVDAEGIKATYANPIFFLKIIMAHLYFIFYRPTEYFRLLIKNRIFGGKKVFWEGVYYAKIVKKLQIKHIHAHFAWNTADCARIIKRLTGASFSLTAHQSDIHRFPQRLDEKLMESKFVLTCTRGNKEYLGHKYGQGVGAKTFCIYHGVDLERFLFQAEENEKKIDVLSVSELVKFKGLEYLIKACAALKSNNLFRKCVIVGKGEEKHNLESLIHQMGLEDKVEIIDPVSHSEIIELYKCAKIFVLPVAIINGAPHGIPNVIAEAMASGLPVIASDVPCIPELIKNGENGFLVPEKDPEALALLINQLLFNKKIRDLIGKNANLTIKNRFDCDKEIKILKGIFERLAKD